MENQTYEDAVLKSVMWWSDKSFRTTLNQNHGDNSEQGGVLSIFLNTASIHSQKNITEEKIKKFESKLTELLMDKNVKTRSYLRILDKDYHPCKFLAEACKYAEIDSNCLPCKSFTDIDDSNRVFAKYQYGSEAIEI